MDLLALTDVLPVVVAEGGLVSLRHVQAGEVLADDRWQRDLLHERRLQHDTTGDRDRLAEVIQNLVLMLVLSFLSLLDPLE